MKKYLKEYLPYLLTVIVILLLRQFVFTVYSVDGRSMDYTLADQQKILASNYFEPERFDISIIHMPEGGKKYIKRIVGMPGETLEIKDDVLYINSQVIDEPYLEAKKKEYPDGFNRDVAPISIPENHYYVIGDSREIGPVAKEKIISEALAVYWPITEMKWLSK